VARRGRGRAFVAAHLPFLPQSLEDIDSINFALGLRHFDPALHQPHPPGYPLYIGLGHVSLAALSWLMPSLPALRVEAVALAVWSLAGGALAIVAAAMLFRALEDAFPDEAARVSPLLVPARRRCWRWRRSSRSPACGRSATCRASRSRCWRRR
jgi:hypothetical protein